MDIEKKISKRTEFIKSRVHNKKKNYVHIKLCKLGYTMYGGYYKSCNMYWYRTDDVEIYTHVLFDI